MAVKRGRSQARRSGGNGAPLPGWAWMILGVVLTIVVVLAAPKLLKGDGEDGFFRPRPNPDARPAPSNPEGEDVVVPDRPGSATPTPTPAAADSGTDAAPEEPQYDFYTLLPGQEVAMTDAELAASARAEETRQRELAQQQAATRPAAQPRDPDAADPAQPTSATPAPAAAATASAAADGERFILQAGSFGSSGDAEALKARIALLGLSARVESAEINGKTMHRVRMGPYATASDLAEAKQKLGNGGLPALAIRAR